MLKFAFMTRNFIHCSSTVTLVILPDDKYIMQTESCDLNKYLNTNFTIQVPTSLTSTHKYQYLVSALISISKVPP